MRMTSERSEIVAGKYHVASPNIKCVADRIGAHIFVFPDGDGEDLRILAYDSREASDLYLEYLYPDQELEGASC